MFRISLIIILFLSILTLKAQEKNSIDWLDFNQLEQAMKEDTSKYILISFYTDWCTYCRKLDREIYPDPTITAEIKNHFIAVKFDAETRDTILFEGQILTNPHSLRRRGPHTLAMLLASRNGRFSVPVTLILDQDFHVLAQSFKYMGKAEMMEFLRL